jgi:hypothetical protein
VVAHTCNLSTQEAEAGGSPAPGLYSEDLSQKTEGWGCGSVVECKVLDLIPAQYVGGA